MLPFPDPPWIPDSLKMPLFPDSPKMPPFPDSPNMPPFPDSPKMPYRSLTLSICHLSLTSLKCHFSLIPPKKAHNQCQLSLTHQNCRSLTCCPESMILPECHCLPICNPKMDQGWRKSQPHQEAIFMYFGYTYLHSFLWMHFWRIEKIWRHIHWGATITIKIYPKTKGFDWL